MKKTEVLEWLSLAPADIPAWLAGGALLGMWFSPNTGLAIACASAAVVLSIVACFLGMRPRTDLSAPTNVAKRVTYPLFVLLVLGCVAWYFLCWNSNAWYFGRVTAILNAKLPEQKPDGVTREKVGYDPETNTIVTPYSINKPFAQIRREYTKES